MAKQNETGAVAVEFALVLPILLLLVFGIVEFGRAYNTQVSLTHAAREGVRAMAIHNNPVVARKAAKDAAVSLNPGLTDINFSSIASCVPGTQVTITINYTLSTITGIAGPFAMKGVGVMRCGG
ncbi:TadE family protein [Arthrobacter sp. H20]|uniref:TadE/TadG family type IV pilus assembly protein n=1 Tax=Arthrobacter sp. H20 TaxID=1267981 RepID=UPI00047B497D|nr:TadE family protein [Arthrobacter sp. H20]